MKTTYLKSKRGFTLIEICIVVALIAILAAIAIPDYLHMEMLAKRTEGVMLLDNLKIAEINYFTDYDTYTLNSNALTIYGIVPTNAQLHYYKTRMCNSSDAKIGYRCFVQATFRAGSPLDVIVLRMGDAGAYNYQGSFFFPEGMTIYMDGTI